MKLNPIYPLMMFLTMILASPVQAVTVDDLYTVEMPIADQTASLRLEVFTAAFHQVVIKASGSDDPLLSPAFEQALTRTARYVKQFTYVNRKGLDELGNVADLLYLRIDFDQQSIENLLRENKFPIWGRERPGSLMIISYDLNQRIQMVSSDTTPELIALIDQAALKLGVPVLFPLMDLEDIALVKSRDIAARQYDQINQLATRYAPDALVIGQVVGRSGSGWRGDWEVRFAEQIFKWDYEDASKELIVEQAIKHLARILALEYALEDHRRVDQTLLLKVSSMNNINSLVKVQKYLESLNVVDAVQVGIITANEVTFRLKLRNKASDLQRLIEFGDMLEQLTLPQVDAQAEGPTLLEYNFIGRGLN